MAAKAHFMGSFVCSPQVSVVVAYSFGKDLPPAENNGMQEKQIGVDLAFVLLFSLFHICT